MARTTTKITYTNLHTKQGTFKVKFEWDARDRAYLVTIPSLPGAITFGTSLQEAKKMARAIADRIEQELKYPGEIKVHVIRENRVLEYAR